MKKALAFINSAVTCFTLFSCAANHASSLDDSKNDPPKITLNGIADSRFRYTNTRYADGREIGRVCSVDPYGNQNCVSPSYAQGPFQNVKAVSEYESVPCEEGRFLVTVAYASEYSLTAEIGYLGEDGKPLEVEDGQWKRSSPIYMAFGRFHEVEMNESSFRAETAPEDATYLIIHIGFYSSTYGDADFLFFSKPFKTQTCVKEIALWPTYGQTDVTHCRFVWGDTRFPDFLPESIDADSLVPGDALEIEYTGELWLLDMGPRIAKIKDGEFVSAKVTHGPVHEVAVNNGVIGQPTGVSLDSMIEKTYAIAQDKALVPMSEVDSGYLVCSALNNEEARVLLTYDPRPDHNS